MIQPIFTSAFSSVAPGRSALSERVFGGTRESEEQKNVAMTTEAAGSGEANFPGGVAPVQQTDTGTKTGERAKGVQAPEKSSDAGKTRSVSGDILDLSSTTETAQTVQNTQTGLAEETRAEESENLSSTSQTKSGSASASASEELSEEEQQQLTELKARDAEVRAHEAAHLAAAGPYARGGASFEYQTGPDGKKYAIGGSVSIDSGPISGDPEATIAKAQTVRSAALAPASPSSQDQKVAAAASQMEADARLQLSREKAEQLSQEDSEETSSALSGTSSMKTESEENSASSLIEQLIAAAEESEDSEGAASFGKNLEKSLSSTSELASFSALSSGSAASAYQQQRFSTAPTRFVAYG